MATCIIPSHCTDKQVPASHIYTYATKPDNFLLHPQLGCLASVLLTQPFFLELHCCHQCAAPRSHSTTCSVNHESSLRKSIEHNNSPSHTKHNAIGQLTFSPSLPNLLPHHSTATDLLDALAPHHGHMQQPDAFQLWLIPWLEYEGHRGDGPA